MNGGTIFSRNDLPLLDNIPEFYTYLREFGCIHYIISLFGNHLNYYFEIMEHKLFRKRSWSLIKRALNLLLLFSSSQISKRHFRIGSHDAGYAKFMTVFRAEIEMENLFKFIHELGFVKLADTPHYKYARFMAGFNDGDEIPYSEYLESFYSEEVEVSKIAFQNTFEFVSKNRQNVEILVSRNDICDSRIIVIDGVHRAALSKAIGLKKIRCVVHV